MGIVAEARAYAADFLNGLAVKLANAGCGGSVNLAVNAARQYEEVAGALKELCLLFPFPSGGSPNEPENVVTAVELIGRAQSAEEVGVRLLERLSRGIRLMVNQE